MKMILKASREGEKKVTRKGSASLESSNHGSGALEILRIKNSASNQTVHPGQWQRNDILRQARPGKRTSSPAPLLQQPRDAARGPSSKKNSPRCRVLHVTCAQAWPPPQPRVTGGHRTRWAAAASCASCAQACRRPRPVTTPPMPGPPPPWPPPWPLASACLDRPQKGPQRAATAPPRTVVEAA